MDKNLKAIGWIGSAIYVVTIVLLLAPKLTGFFSLEVNAVGDFLAGVFGPLSVFWLILGFYQQGYELRQNNDSLEQQARELKASVEQQKNLIAVSEAHHKAMEANAKLEHERIEMSLEPKFALMFVKSEVVEEGRVFVISLTNGGHAITNVKVTVGSSPYDYPLIDSRQTIEINHVRADVHEVVLKILVIYFNGLEERKAKQFSILLKKYHVEEKWNVEIEHPNGAALAV